MLPAVLKCYTPHSETDARDQLKSETEVFISHFIMNTFRIFKSYSCTLQLLFMFAFSAIPTAVLSDSEDDQWNEAFDETALEVNEGELVLLPRPPEKMVHHHHNQIKLASSSLVDGWVTLHQCHKHIDPVAELQIIYNERRIKNLSIDTFTNINQAWVEAHTVQLRGIHRGASLCIDASTKALTMNQDGTYSLNNGPFMRRFLDGYYPMHVTLDIEYPQDCLNLKETTPIHQEGFEVTVEHDRVQIKTWFEGRLMTEFVFAPTF